MKDLHRILQGWYKGVQKLRRDMEIVRKLGDVSNTERLLNDIEKVIVPLGVKAKRDPNFRLTVRQAEGLNRLLGIDRRRDNLSRTFREHINAHCRGCDLGDMKRFEFVSVDPTNGYRVEGWWSKRDVDTFGGDDIDMKVERLSEVLENYHQIMGGIHRNSDLMTTFTVENYRGATVIKAQTTLPRSVAGYDAWMYDEYGHTSMMNLKVNGVELNPKMLNKVIEYFKTKSTK